MKRSIAIAWGALLLAGCSQGSSPAPAGPLLDTDAPALGTVTAAASIPCPAGAAGGASCSRLNVSCPRLDGLGVVVAVSEPAASARATVLLHDNLGGVAFFDAGFVDAYHAASFRVVQAQWASDWEQSDVGIKHAACRYATLVEWTFANIHGADRTRGFCAQSWGGGSGGLAYSLTHYRMGDVLDAITVSAGPPFARIDLGCDPGTAPRAVCAPLSSVPVAYSGGVLSIISEWEVAPTCGSSAGAPLSEVARWQADSVLSPGATLAFPDTSFGAWYCINGADATLGQGATFLDQASFAEASVHCVSGGGGGGQCQGQAPWPSALPDMVADLQTRCVPRHSH